jgi:2-polyprenyl-6-methoxyphenol hydroxylase-like FAD-dependent oxidoreductase
MDTRNRAVVLGGGIAGLLAAQVLADSYTQVTVVERDPLPGHIAHRRGLPHGQHVHGMLPRGLQILEDLLPGVTDAMVAAGAHPGDILANTRWYLNGRRLCSVPTGLAAVSASRPLIEATIRERVRARPNVTVLDGYDIVGLKASATRSRIVGVRVTSLNGAGSQLLPADLVIDATGRGSRTPRWLTELGFEAPPEDRVGIDLAYSTRRFEAPPEIFGDDIVIVTARFPGQRRGAVMQRLEDGTVLATLTGILGERPPAGLADFAGYAQSLAAPETHLVARLGRPLGEAAVYKVPTYVRRRYERLTAFPRGLLVVGDAVCGFNPVYGQGMSVAAINAVDLRNELSHGDGPDPTRYFATVARTLDIPWGLSVLTDLSVPGVTGPVLPASPLTAEYVGSLQLGAAEEPELAQAFIRVMSLIDPPPALLRPEIVELVRSTQLRLAS